MQFHFGMTGTQNRDGTTFLHISRGHSNQVL